MNSHVHKYYKKGKKNDFFQGMFHDVVPLHERGLSIDKVQEMVPLIPKGWVELAALSAQDRVHFVKEFWLSVLPFTPHIHRLLFSFFSSLDDIGVYIVQWDKNLSYEAEIVYSLADNSCFYHGAVPLKEAEIAFINQQFGGNLPQDFLKFLLIHNGFSRHTDTGVFRAEDLIRIQRKLIHETQDLNILIKSKDHLIDPSELIPFYESFGQRAYQCFFKEWYPDLEMGNVFLSLKDRSISCCSLGEQSLAFASFLDWLMFYVEVL